MVKHWLDRMWPIALLMMGGAAIILGSRYLVSAYHVEAAGRAMDKVQSPATDLIPAHRHLQQAVKWDPRNAQAYRLLSQVYLAQDDWFAASEALAHYRELRPASPLGYLAVVDFYTQLEDRMDALSLVNLLTALPQADVQMPDTPVVPPYSPPDSTSWHGYVGRTTFAAPPDSVERPALYMHSSSSATYALQLPPQPAYLHFAIALASRASDEIEEGVVFEVLVDGKRVFSEHLDKPMGSQGWQERTVDLAPWAGEDVALTLKVAPGPQGGSTGDWGIWGEPQVVEPEWVALKSLVSPTQLAQAWHELGMTTEDLIHLGEAARGAGQPDKALVWYKRAIQLEPSLRDPWFYLGQAHEAQGEWQKAMEAYDYAISLRHSSEIGRSRVQAQKGNIYLQLLDPPQLEEAQAAYEAALAEHDFRSPREAAWVEARLGQVYYALDGDAAEAEARLLRALELAPEDAWLHIILGDFYRQEGRVADAVEMYELAMERDPNSQAALARLEELTQ